jgi:hypothetical protein
VAAVPSRLQQLYDAARTIGPRFKRSPASVFDPCGLILEQPPRRDYSWCTPKSALTFASTGGDGVHYSYLDLPDGTPIVMTMPANDRLNYVVAEGFDEFLGLGFHVGWFALEQIAYQPDWALGYFAAEDTEKDDRKRMLMAALRSALEIQYVALRLERIHALTKKHEVQLQVPAQPP